MAHSLQPTSHHHPLHTMGVPRQEFQSFQRKYDKDQHEIKTMLQHILHRQPPSTDNGASLRDQRSSPFASFDGVIPHPKTARERNESSFVNVPQSLKLGILEYNQTADEDNQIPEDEFQGSLLSWSYRAYDCVQLVIGQYSLLN